MCRVSTIALITLVSLSTVPAFAVNVTLNDGGTSFTQSIAYDGGTVDDNETYSPTSLPSSGTAKASAGGSSSTTGSNLSNDGFELTFDHALIGTRDAYSESYGSLYFSVDADSGYVLEGVYAAIDVEGRWTAMEVFLYDQTEGEYLFHNLQRSDATPNESFTLGLEDGDLTPVLAGSLSGNMLAGHQYQLYFRLYIWNSGQEDTTPATASGSLTLAFVPEFTACGDGIDNDADGLTDFVGGDPGCAAFDDLSENDPTLPCDDGADNDGDGFIDTADPACSSGNPYVPDPTAPREATQCQDGANNDLGQDPNPGHIDYDGGLSALGYVVAEPDPQCVGKPWQDREKKLGSYLRCGLGAELALILPPLMWLSLRRRRWS